MTLEASDNLLICNVSSKTPPHWVRQAPTTLSALAALLAPELRGGHNALAELLDYLQNLQPGTVVKLRAVMRFSLGLMLVNAIKVVLGLPADNVVATAAIVLGESDSCTVFLGVADAAPDDATRIPIAEFNTARPAAALPPLQATLPPQDAFDEFCKSLNRLVWANAPRCEHGMAAAGCHSCMIRLAEEARARPDARAGTLQARLLKQARLQNSLAGARKRIELAAAREQIARAAVSAGWAQLPPTLTVDNPDEAGRILLKRSNAMVGALFANANANANANADANADALAKRKKTA